MNNFLKRSITGILFVCAIILSIWLHQYAYLSVFFCIVLLGMHEFKELLKSGQTKIQTINVFLTGGFLFLISFFISAKIISFQWLFILIPLIISVFITELFRKTETPITNIACTFLVPFFIALPFSFLHLLSYNSGEYDSSILIGFFILVWSNDTGAYLVGVNFGKRRLFERISPKKSWEGAIGGLIFTLLISIVLSHFMKNFSLINWLIIGGIISIMGIFGDLTESMIKRSVNKKDSGAILPGHGGIFDRFDSVIFAAPMVFGYLIVFN